MVELDPGQFVFGRKKASIETGLSERKIRTCLDKLKKFQNVTIKTTNKFSIITVINWGTYQQDETKSDQLNDQQVTNKRPTSDQQVTTNKNNKHIKNNKKTNTSFKNYLQEKIIENNFIESKDKIFEFFNYRNSNFPKKDQYNTELKINGLFRHLNGCRDDGLIISDCIEISMESGWKTPNPDYFKNKKQNNNQKFFPGTTMTEQDCNDFINGDD